MKAELSTTRHASTATAGDPGELAVANRIANAVKERWQRGEPPDAAGVLATHPEIEHCRSVVLDLAYTEYRLRQRAGESIEAETFAGKFPSLEQSLFLLIQVQSLLSHDPELQLLQDSLVWPEAGSRFLQFDLVAEIGRGAFGRVFLATESTIGGRDIVIKVTPQAGGEANILGKLRHPNIVPIYSFYNDETHGLAAFCMPYLGRATLCDVLAPTFHNGYPPLGGRAILDAIAAVNGDLASKETTPPAAVLRRGAYIDGVIHIFAQLADALAHAHQCGIYHRDLKPSNVLMTIDGRPLLLDFNLSIDSHLPIWKIGGTLPYMAPEELAKLAAGRNEQRDSHYDPRSDLFSLGVMFYELLTGTLPFTPIPRNLPLAQAATKLRELQAAGPRPIRELNDRVDRRLARLVDSCLAFALERRPTTAQKLAEALHRELSPLRRSRRWVGNHRRFVLGMSAALCSLVLAIGLFFALRPPYSVRQFQLGQQLLDQGRYSQAVDSLTDSIRADPNSADALFARGKAYQRLGEYQLAFQDFMQSNIHKPNSLVKACEGYCSNQTKYHKAAIAAYFKALELGFERPAILHNNIGYSYLMLGQLTDAEKQFQQVIQLDGNLLAARYNMMILQLRPAIRDRTLSSTALVNAKKAIEMGPGSADLYHVASALYATAAKHDATLAPLAIEYAGKAVELGMRPDTFASDPRFAALYSDPAFRAALDRPASNSMPAKTAQLVDPLDYP